MSRESFIKDCEEFYRSEVESTRVGVGTLKLSAIIDIKSWAENSRYFSEDIGSELLRLALDYHSEENLDRSTVSLTFGDEFEKNLITTKYPSIDVGGCGDGLFPVLFFRARHLIIVDPCWKKYTKEVRIFDFGKGKECLVIDYVPQRIENYEIDFHVGSIMANNLERGLLPHVFSLARKSLLTGGFLFISPSSRGKIFRKFSKEVPDEKKMIKELFYVPEKLEDYRLEKIYTGSDYDLYEKMA